MASITYYGDFGGTSAGTNGKSITVTGTALPSNAKITSVTYTLNITSGGYSSSKKWQLLWFAIGSSTGSPAAGATTDSMSSTRHTFSGNMSFSQSDVSKFTSGYFTLYAKANTTHSSTSYMRAFSITINYATPSLGTPTAPTITQNANGTYTASWNAVSYSNGSGTPQYRLWCVTDGYALSSYSTSRSVTLDIGAYAYPIQFRVQATYSGLTTNGTTTTKTFTTPSLSTPTGVKLSAATGETTTLSWNASSVTATTVSGSITYSIRKNGTQIATTTRTSFTFDKETTKSWGTNAVTLTIVATAATVNKHYPTLTSGTSQGVSFTYKAAGATVAYFNGSSWVNCYVYYFDGRNWIKVNPYYFNGTSWVKCSTT